MFFADPAAACANIARAMRPGGRVAWMVWQGLERNEWSGGISQALAPITAVSADTPRAFSLGEPTITKDLLRNAGFVSSDFSEVREPVFYGADIETAFDALIDLYAVKATLARSGGACERALHQLRKLLEAHKTAEGVLFDSRAWIITARRS